MATLRLATALILGALVALPLAAAAPASGALDVVGDLRLAGPLTAVAPAGDLVWNASAAPQLTLQATGIHVERIGTSQTVAPTPLGGVGVTSSAIDSTADVADGAIRFATGEGSQIVALHADGAVSLSASAADVRPVSSARLAQVMAGVNEISGSCSDPGTRCLATQGTYELGAPDAVGTVSGPMRLLVYGPDVRVVDASGQEQVFRSGPTSTTSGATVQYDNAWVVLTISRATGAFPASPARSAYLAEPTLAGAQATLAAASGHLSVGGTAYQAHAEAVEAQGALRLALAPVAPGDVGIVGKVVYAPGFHADVAGDVTHLNLHAAPVYEQPAARAIGLAAVGAALLGAAAYYWPLLSFRLTAMAAPLYTRLRQPEILDNDVRNRIYDIIRANPGISARAVHRESAQSWGTVVYHLRQLERHHLVVSRALGRTRNYYENHGKYRGMEVQLACLQAPRALALARVILAAPGATQEQLVERSGFPQPTTSYYVRKLRKAGLVDEAREGRYVRYLPAQDLERFVQTADPVVGHPVPSGVNA
jgi:DNA-binding transcriptional ArsR family regulator